MPESQYRARQVGAKTQEVINYDHDEGLPGKPLHLLIPGGLVALAALAVIIVVGYQTWFKGELAQSTGLVLIALLAPFYVGGVFLFSYGYELYNIPWAIRLTAIIVFLTFAAVVIVAVLFFVLGSGKGLPEILVEKEILWQTKCSGETHFLRRFRGFQIWARWSSWVGRAGHAK